MGPKVIQGGRSIYKGMGEAGYRDKALAPMEEGEKAVFDKSAWNPSKFTNYNLAVILNRLVNGYPMSLALAEAGITRGTWDNWCQKCADGNKRYANLIEIAEIAKNRGMAKLHRRLLELSEKDGKLTLEILRALSPEIYMEKKLVGVQNNTKVQIEYIDVGDRE